MIRLAESYVKVNEGNYARRCLTDVHDFRLTSNPAIFKIDFWPSCVLPVTRNIKIQARIRGADNGQRD
jgi:hypothetical protein